MHPDDRRHLMVRLDRMNHFAVLQADQRPLDAKDFRRRRRFARISTDP